MSIQKDIYLNNIKIIANKFKSKTYYWKDESYSTVEINPLISENADSFDPEDYCSTNPNHTGEIG